MELGEGSGGTYVANAALRFIVAGGLPKNAVLQRCHPHTD